MDNARRQLHLDNVEKHKDLTLAALDYLWKNPETGFREWKAHKYLWDAFVALGYAPVAAGNIPGFYADLDTGRPGPCVGVFGEMDALIVEGHPECDAETGAVHSCGHCCQVAGLLGLAAALKEPGALDGLCGKIRLMAVPAEELIEVDFREQLRKDGVVEFYGGKTEFMRRGILNGVDLAMMCHSSTAAPHKGSVRGGSNGCITKQVTFLGRSAHAGGSPHKGINALYAANQGLNSINALRETFRDETHIRVHPIITCGGTVVNAIPEKVTMESYIRGKTMEDIREANNKVNRALAASAAALGAGVILCDRPGYFPRLHSRPFMELAVEAMEQVLQGVTYAPDGWGTGCSDIGDVSAVMPTIHPYIGGCIGTEHGDNYAVADGDAACVDMARVQSLILELLLENDAVRAKEIVAEFQPTCGSIAEYLDYTGSLILDREAVKYDEKGNVLLNLGSEEMNF